MKCEKVRIPTNSGKNIAAVIHHASGTDRLAILCPGNLDTKDYSHLVGLAEVLSEHGYTTVRFDPIGTWESDGIDSDYLVSQYLIDVRSVVDYMLGRRTYNEIVLGGHSRGAMVSLLYAESDPRITKIVAIMPPMLITEKELKEKKYVDWQKNGFNISIRDVPGSDGKREFRLPYKHLVDRQKFDVIKAVKMINIPVLFVAGECDEVVLPEDVKSLFDSANQPKKYLLLKGIGHDYRHIPSEVQLVNNEIISALHSI